MNLKCEFSGIAACFIATVGIVCGAPKEAAHVRVKGVPKAKTPQPLRKIEITAKSYRYGNGLFVATGSAQVVDGDMVLKADLLEVKMRKNVAAADAKDAAKQSPYEYIKATGTKNRVTLKTAQGVAVADSITYNLSDGPGRAVLAGTPEVTLADGGRMFGAKSIVFDRGRQLLWTIGGKPKAVIPNDGERDSLLTPSEKSKGAPEDKSSNAKGKTPGKTVVKTAQDPIRTKVGKDGKPPVPRPPTEVEADKLVYDMKANVIRCEGKVHVIDEELDLKTDLLEVYRNDKGVTTKIVAKGKENPVRLETVMKDFKRGIATGPELVYDVAKQTLVLAGKANLKTERGQFIDVERVNFTRSKDGFTVNVERGETGKFILWTEKSLLDLKDLNKEKPKKQVPATTKSD